MTVDFWPAVAPEGLRKCAGNARDVRERIAGRVSGRRPRKVSPEGVREMRGQRMEMCARIVSVFPQTRLRATRLRKVSSGGLFGKSGGNVRGQCPEMRGICAGGVREMYRKCVGRAGEYAGTCVWEAGAYLMGRARKVGWKSEGSAPEVCGKCCAKCARKLFPRSVFAESVCAKCARKVCAT